MRRFLLNVLIHTQFLLASSVTAASEWTEIKQKDGIIVWSRQVPGTSILAFRGRKTLDVPITKVAYVLASQDIDSKKRWIDMVKDFKVIKQINENEGLSYSSYDLPFPITDRDYVLVGKRMVDNEHNFVRTSLSSVEHPDFPESESAGVRAILYGSSFTLYPKDGGMKTDVVVEIQTDPKGWLPTWLVNLVNQNWPINTLTNLEIEAKRPDSKHDPYVLKSLKSIQEMASKLAH